MHDKNGKLLSEGDVVMIPCRVTSVMPNSDDNKYCNVNLETIEKMGQDDPSAYHSTMVVNAKQVVKVEKYKDGQITIFGEVLGPGAPAPAPPGEGESGGG